MRRIHYSWIILAITFFSIIIAGIVISSSGVFIDAFYNEFGWDRSVIALAFAISLFLYGISGPIMAALLEVIGMKKMMVLSMSTLLIGCLLTLIMQDSWHLIIIWGIIIGLGSSLFLTVVSPYISNHWFVKRRGFVVGILTASTATGQLILLPILASIIDKQSWRWAIGLIIILSSIALLLILLFMKNTPKEIGILPYGQDENSKVIANEKLKKNPIILAFKGLSGAIKVKEFWLLAGSFFICGLSTNGLIGTHFISYCIGFGVPIVTAASILSFIGGFNLIGTTLSGWISDRFDSRWLLFWYYCLRGASLVLLPFALMEGSYVMLMIFTIFFGLDWAATVPPTINLSRQVFGIKQSGITYAWIFASHQARAATAAYGGGVIFKFFDTYTLAFVLSGVFCALACLFVISIKKPQPNHLITKKISANA